MKSGMKIALAGLSVATVVGGAFSHIAMGDPKDATETIRLHHIKPSDLLREIASPTGPTNDPNRKFSHPMLPNDIRQIDTDDTTGKLVVTGGSDGIERLHALASILDVAAPSVKLDIDIVRSPLRSEDFGKGTRTVSAREGEIVGKGSLRVDNDQATDVAIVADQHLFLAHLQPHIQAGHRVSVMVRLSSEPIGTAESGVGRTVAGMKARTTVDDTVVLVTDAVETASGRPGDRITVPAHTTTADGTYFFQLKPHVSHND